MKLAGFCFMTIGILLVVIWFKFPDANATNPPTLDEIKWALGIVKMCEGWIIFLIFVAGVSLLAETKNSSFRNYEISKELILEITTNTIKVGAIHVASKNLPEKYYNWDSAKNSAISLGDGWRLPTKDELNEIYRNKDIIGEFIIGNYWSSTETTTGESWTQNFVSGEQSPKYKDSSCYVRAVRSI